MFIDDVIKKVYPINLMESKGTDKAVQNLGRELDRIYNKNGRWNIDGTELTMAEVAELYDVYKWITKDHVKFENIETVSKNVAKCLKALGFNVVDQGIGWVLSESMKIDEASNYQGKLNEFLAGYDPDVVKWVKKCLNNLFLGVKEDYDGYIEGKRPTIRDYGTHKILKMNLQANSDVKKGSNDVPGKWNFHDIVKDYCTGLGKIIEKQFDGDRYTTVMYNHVEDLDSLHSWSDYEEKSSPAQYPMVGVDRIGVGGSYKNITKDVPGSTYSIVVSLPNLNAREYSNPFMTKSGNKYVFRNKQKDSDNYEYVLTYDMSDGEFSTREFRDSDADTMNAVYKRSKGSFKAFQELVDTFNANTTLAGVEKILKDNGVRLEHSWWFNPYTD